MLLFENRQLYDVIKPNILWIVLPQRTVKTYANLRRRGYLFEICWRTKSILCNFVAHPKSHRCCGSSYCLQNWTRVEGEHGLHHWCRCHSCPVVPGRCWTHLEHHSCHRCHPENQLFRWGCNWADRINYVLFFTLGPICQFISNKVAPACIVHVCKVNPLIWSILGSSRTKWPFC